MCLGKPPHRRYGFGFMLHHVKCYATQRLAQTRHIPHGWTFVYAWCPCRISWLWYRHLALPRYVRSRHIPLRLLVLRTILLPLSYYYIRMGTARPLLIRSVSSLPPLNILLFYTSHFFFCTIHILALCMSLLISDHRGRGRSTRRRIPTTDCKGRTLS